MNKIVYKSEYYGMTFEFADIDLIHGTMKDTLNNALVSETLSIDTAQFTLVGRERGGKEPLYDENGELVYTQETPKPLYDVDGEPLYDANNDPLYDNGLEVLYVNTLSYATYDFSKFTYGDEVDYYVDNVLQGKYYLNDVVIAGDGSGEITFKMESMMGLLNDIDHEGGIYTNANAGDIIASIMGEYPYSIDAGLSSTKLNGWLPYDTCLANLTQVLFACGASILKDANGDLEFTYNLPQTATVFDIDTAYLGGERRDIAPATIIKVTEHTFYPSASVQADELYNNTGGTSASNYEIRFDKPYHTLIATGLTINSSGANWAIVSGVGKLTGIPYLHIQRVRNLSTGINAKPNEKTAANCTLISSLNSDQVMDRLAAYYSQTQEVQIALVINNEKPGSLIRVPDPADHENDVLGYIKGMKRTFSNKFKAEITLTSGWVPGHIGNSYDSFLIVRSSDINAGTWTVPNAIRGKRALVVLFGGAQGGQGGWYGNGGERVPGDSSFAAKISERYANIDWYVGNPGNVGHGADGGNGGHGGYPGKMLMFNVASLANSYTVSLGTGGTGGAGGTTTRSPAFTLDVIYVDPEEGQYGTHSTFGTYDTDNGVFIEADFINLITGQIIAPKYGETGVKGGKGGDGGVSKPYVKNSKSASYDYSNAGRGKPGSNVGANTGGLPADGTVGYTREAYISTSSDKRYHHILLCGGGGGGGAAAGANGNNGLPQTSFPRITDEDGDYEAYSGTWYGRNTDVPSDVSYILSSNGGDGADAVTIPSQSDLMGGTGGAGAGGGGGAGAQLGRMNTAYLNGNFSRGWGLNGKGGNGSQGGQGSEGWFIVYYKA